MTRKKMTKKDRKHDGRVYPKLTVPNKALIEEGIEINPEWNDWIERRDGFREGRYTSEKLIRPGKVKKMLKVRKAKKEMKK